MENRRSVLKKKVIDTFCTFYKSECLKLRTRYAVEVVFFVRRNAVLIRRTSISSLYFKSKYTSTCSPFYYLRNASTMSHCLKKYYDPEDINGANYSTGTNSLKVPKYVLNAEKFDESFEHIVNWREEYRPHVFPPNVDDGPMSQAVWNEYGCCDFDVSMILVCKSVGNVSPFKMEVESKLYQPEKGYNHVFGNCLNCWKKKDRNFTMLSNESTRFDLPRVGRCGCIVCDGCISKKLEDTLNQESSIPCPNCELEVCFFRDVSILALNKSILDFFISKKEE